MGSNSVDGRDVKICLGCKYLDMCTALFEKVVIDEKGRCDVLEKIDSFIDRCNSIPR